MTDEQPQQDPWIDEQRDKLTAQEQSIDATTLGRLRAARREALGRLENEPRRRWERYYWAPLVLIVGVIGFNLQTPSQTAVDTDTTALLEDMPLLSGEDDLDMIDEMEFYLWLADVEKRDFSRE